MAYVVFVGMFGLVLGLVGVASNPSPYFAAFGLVISSAAGCLILVTVELSFLSLVFFLIYLGGMLVVFAYSAAMAAEPYPEAWGGVSIFYVMGYICVLVLGSLMIDSIDVVSDFGSSLIRYDWAGVSELYSFGFGFLLISGWVLLLTLFVVLELVRWGALGAVSAV
uniref:NADH-ubiquinone oxidoreductase chain 6 n=1 Tax=Uraeotyphlus cf. oxyurus MW-212 TaxID=262585 RepID=Q64JN4_9AMPH|nr:NADH dehydrogenase subunit 6 [Uraeotyphlus cf. oxyurus MW-212]AAS13755.1 NADH dehydrogenase subunit 6 [Uraeotyphlus cf. oxyurus MW-212]